jgi:hypothetical protein
MGAFEVQLAAAEKGNCACVIVGPAHGRPLCRVDTGAARCDLTEWSLCEFARLTDYLTAFALEARVKKHRVSSGFNSEGNGTPHL